LQSPPGCDPSAVGLFQLASEFREAIRQWQRDRRLIFLSQQTAERRQSLAPSKGLLA
jgi:hypothetical protein